MGEEAARQNIQLEEDSEKKEMELKHHMENNKEKLRQETQRKIRDSNAMLQTGTLTQEEAEKARQQIINDHKKNVEEMNKQLEDNRLKQQDDLERKIREREEKKKRAKGGAAGPPPHPAAAAVTTPAAISLPVPTAVVSMMSPRASVTTPIAPPLGVSPAAVADAQQQGQLLTLWVDAMMRELVPPIMHRLDVIYNSIQKLVQSNFVNYHLDARDKTTKCEGELRVVDAATELKTQPQIVYQFGNYIKDVLRRELDAASFPARVRIMIASALPFPSVNASASAFKHSVYYDSAADTLYIRDTRLSTLGEYVVVLLHALAHIKTDCWNDGDPNFVAALNTYYEIIMEDMFLGRLAPQLRPPSAAARTLHNHRTARPVILNADTLKEIEEKLKGVSAANRDKFLKGYFRLE